MDSMDKKLKLMSACIFAQSSPLGAAESVLLPFGYTEKRLDDAIRGKMQRNLDGYLFPRLAKRPFEVKI